MSERHLWEIGALMGALGGRANGVLPPGVTGLSIDTRTLQPGDAFFAIRGDRFDGHKFLTAAGAAGAAVFVVAQPKLPALGKVQGPMIVVDDVLEALGRLAMASRARSKARIVAVTGSVGKTTTKEALRHALEASGPVHASAASFNNHWGVPLSLARMPADARFGIFEIGMNHPNEIRPLVKLVRPHVAVITRIAPVHLGFFDSVDDIAVAKGEIFEGVIDGGTALLNADDPYRPALAAMANHAGVNDIKTFGSSAEADYRRVELLPTPDGALLKLNIHGVDADIAMHSAAVHLAENLTAVMGAAALVGADVAASAAALSSWRAGRGRGARLDVVLGDGRRITVIDESYNANPVAMRAAISVLGATGPTNGGRRIAILGDMLELGKTASAMHAELAEPLEEARVERVYMLGEAMKALDDALDGRLPCEWHQSLDELEASLLAQVRDGDVLMVKASNSMGLSKIVDRLTSASKPEPVSGAVSGASAGGA